MNGYTIDRTFIDFPSMDDDAIIVYFKGCSHHCNGCHSRSLQEYESFDIDALMNDIKRVNKYNETKNIVLSGGDPLYCSHIKKTEELTKRLKELGFTICIYTGHDIDFVKNNFRGVFDFVKCGKFVKELSRFSEKNDEMMVLASSNQNFYDSKYKQLSTNGKLYWRKNG